MKVVYYHLVTDSEFEFYNGITVSKKKFEKDLKHYKKYYNVISLKEANEYIKQGISLKKCLVITFDDGYKENFINVIDLLDKYNLKATFFLNSSTINNKKVMWRDALTYLSKHITYKQLNDFKQEISYSQSHDFDLLKSTKNLKLKNISTSINNLWNNIVGFSQEKFAIDNNIYIDNEDLRIIITSNHEIGIHSTDHPNFQTLSLKEGIDEILNAYNFFINNFNYKPISMSYPFGSKHLNINFYKYLIENTELKYFLGIDYNYFSNTNLDKSYILERLGMEDGRNFFISFYLRPLIRLIR